MKRSVYSKMLPYVLFFIQALSFILPFQQSTQLDFSISLERKKPLFSPLSFFSSSCFSTISAVWQWGWCHRVSKPKENYHFPKMWNASERGMKTGMKTSVTQKCGTSRDKFIWTLKKRQNTFT